MSRLVYATPDINSASLIDTNVLEGVAMNAAAALRTWTVNLNREAEKVIATVDLTHSAATAITLTPTKSLDGTNFDPVPTYTIAAGTATMNDLVWTKAVTGDDQLVGELDVSGVDKLRLVVSSTGGGASDLFNLRVMVIGRK